MPIKWSIYRVLHSSFSFKAILGQVPVKLNSPISSAPRSRPSRESRNQALANLGLSVTTNSSPAPLTSTTAITSSAVGSSGRYPPSLIVPSSSSFKHKKKLQLKHEAQLRLENQSSNQSDLPSPSSPSPPLPLPPIPQPVYPGSGYGSISSQNDGVPSVQQKQQHERIVIRLLRSDIEKGKSKSKKKHRHKSRRSTEAAGDDQQQEQSGSNRLGWSPSRPSGVPSYTVSLTFPSLPPPLNVLIAISLSLAIFVESMAWINLY